MGFFIYSHTQFMPGVLNETQIRSACCGNLSATSGTPFELLQILQQFNPFRSAAWNGHASQPCEERLGSDCGGSKARLECGATINVERESPRHCDTNLSTSRQPLRTISPPMGGKTTCTYSYLKSSERSANPLGAGFHFAALRQERAL